MPQITPNSEEEERPNISRLELARSRVGKTAENTSQLQTTHSESPSIETKPIQEAQPVREQETQQLPAMPYPTYSLGQPSFHDRRSKVPYNQRYQKDNVMLDVRLLPYIYHWMETHGMNKTDAVNRAWLKVLLADGYQIDPTILDRPCKPEDLPKKEGD